MGTTLGAAVAVALVPALVDWPALLSLALSLWVGGCLIVSLLDRSPRAYVMMLAGYTAAIIGFSSVDHPYAIFDTAAARDRDRAGHHLRHRVAQPVLAAVRGAEAGAETASVDA
jgi:hypothetical protein